MHGRVKEEQDYNILKKNLPRFPKKTAEEVIMLDKVFNALELLLEEDERRILQLGQ